MPFEFPEVRVELLKKEEVKGLPSVNHEKVCEFGGSCMAIKILWCELIEVEIIVLV